MPRLENQTARNVEEEKEEEVVAQLEADDQQSESMTSEITTASDMASAHRVVQNAKEQLLKSKNKQLFFTFADSTYMTEVKDAITALNSSLEKSMPDDEQQFDSALDSLRQDYHRLIDSAQAYVDHITQKGKGKSKSGKIRLELTRQILAQSKNEIAAFEMSSKQLYAMSRQSSEGNTWDQVLYNVRAVKISEDSPNITKTGAGTSTVYRRDEGNGKTSYIKEEEKLSTGENGIFWDAIVQFASSGAPNAEQISKNAQSRIIVVAENNDASIKDVCDRFFHNMALFENILAFDADKMRPGESIKDYKKRIHEDQENLLRQNVQELLQSKTYDYLKEGIGDDIEGVVAFFKFLAKKENEFTIATDKSYSGAGITAGEAMSNRNVSTSRIAERYGMGDTVAKSETILMEKEDGTFTRANSMEGVESISMGDLVLYARANDIKITYSPNAIRQLYQLQILDLICGQIDRHLNNYNIFYEEVTPKTYLVTGIKAIDNDMSFGAEKLIPKKNGAFGGNQRVLESGGKVSIPFLSRDFYNRLMAYTPEMAAYDQVDIRSKAELEALKQRITIIQNQILGLVQAGRITLLDTDEEWEKAKDKLYEMNDRDELAISYVQFPMPPR